MCCGEEHDLWSLWVEVHYGFMDRALKDINSGAAPPGVGSAFLKMLASVLVLVHVCVHACVRTCPCACVPSLRVWDLMSLGCACRSLRGTWVAVFGHVLRVVG